MENCATDESIVNGRDTARLRNYLSVIYGRNLLTEENGKGFAALAAKDPQGLCGIEKPSRIRTSVEA